MTRQKYRNVVRDTQGDAVSGASVEVRDSAGGLATLYAADTGVTTLLNPLTAGNGVGEVIGGFEFWIDEADYGDFSVTVGVGASADTFPIRVDSTDKSFTSRDLLVDHISKYGAIDGAEYRAGGLSYIGQTGATAISDLPGLLRLSIDVSTNTTPSMPWDGRYAGTWLTSNKIVSTETGTENSGTYATLYVRRDADGLAVTGAAHSNVALMVESRKNDYLTTLATGQTVGFMIATAHGRHGDGGGSINFDSKRVYASGGDYTGGMLGIEGSLTAVDETNTTLRQLQVYMGQMYATAGFAPDNQIGFGTEPRVGHTFSAYAAIERSDLSAAFNWVFAASSSRDNANIFYGVTGNAHADGPGRVRSTAGSILAPTYSFSSDTGAGMHSGGAGVLAFSAGGVNVLSLSATTVSPKVHINAISGSTAAPSYSFSSDTGAGMHSGGEGVLAFSAGGVLGLTVNPTAVNFRQPIQRDGVQVLNTQGAAVADATDSASAITQLNAWLARARAHGLIAT